jgi:DNA replication protein DnaC
MTGSSLTSIQTERMAELLVAFKLPTVHTELARRLGDAGFGDALPVVLEVFEAEADARRERRVGRLLRASQLPPGKTLDTLDVARMPKPLVTKIREVSAGDFVDRAVNILCFGLPGVGKSHVAAAIGHELVRRGRSVFFAPTYEVVQHLLAAKRDLALPRALRRLDVYDLVVLDDLGYVQQTPEEAEILFTLVSERYERRSLLITSNLVFSEWERIFRNAMATAAAIDRLVHHSVVLEFVDVTTYRNPERDNYTGAATAPPAKEDRSGRRPRKLKDKSKKPNR